MKRLFLLLCLLIPSLAQAQQGALAYDYTRGIYFAGATNDASHQITLTAPTLASSYALIWPNAQGGASTVLQNDGSGNLSWAAGGGGGGVTSIVFNSPLTGGTITTTGTVGLGTVPVANGGTNVTSYAVGDVLYASGSTTLSKLAIGSAGQVLSVNTGATAPQWSSLFSVNTVGGTTQALAVNNTYVFTNASLSTGTLPSTAAVGDIERILSTGAGMTRVAQNASQTISGPKGVTATGTGGYLQCNVAGSYLTLMCTTANNGWYVIESGGWWYGDAGQSVVQVPDQYAYLTSDQTTASASLVSVSGLSVSIAPSEVWAFDVAGHLRGTANSLKWGVNGPSGATVNVTGFGNSTSATAYRSDNVTALATASGTAITSVSTTLGIRGVMVNSTTAGTLQIQMLSTSGTSGFGTGTWLHAFKVN